MKNTIKCLGIIAIVAIISIFSSCGEADTEGNDPKIYGTWKHSSGSPTYTFNENNTMGSGLTWSTNGRYGGVITITHNAGIMTFTYTAKYYVTAGSPPTMTITESDYLTIGTYYRQ